MESEENQVKKGTDEEKTPDKKVKRQASQEQLNHPLHGVKLKEVLESLVGNYGWEYLANEVNIMCFKHSPSIKVSLKFLRKYKWAREHVQDLYVRMVEAGIDPNLYKNKKSSGEE
ncbi:MAG: hypothetical protein Crog4KO_16570 [Crocinitomicaceae bacterium]